MSRDFDSIRQGSVRQTVQRPIRCLRSYHISGSVSQVSRIECTLGRLQSSIARILQAEGCGCVTGRLAPDGLLELSENLKQ
ncbi:hypothetical protein WJX74_002365 [Apatococcus lobatus]|uniref:Uncharacterized protein n=1 Tax=Apatococcus lobatus TaxID=904363 RepID=A0AAW1S329_9CHLO